MNIQEYCDAAYQNALDHGFHDVENSYSKTYPELMQSFELAAIARMHSELAEAEDAGRVPSAKIQGFRHDTEEFADLLIRIFDWCGYRGYDLQDAFNEVRSCQASDKRRLIEACHYYLGQATENVRDGVNPVQWFARATVSVFLFHQRDGAEDIEAAIQAKMEYNKSRPYMHGKLS